MSDIVERLKNPSYVSIVDDETTNWKLDEAKTTADMREAAAEIERLHSLVGAISPGQSVSDIKELLRTPEGIAKLNARLHGERTTP
jgi:hypothetical protein